MYTTKISVQFERVFAYRNRRASRQNVIRRYGGCCYLPQSFLSVSSGHIHKPGWNRRGGVCLDWRFYTTWKCLDFVKLEFIRQCRWTYMYMRGARFWRGRIKILGGAAPSNVALAKALLFLYESGDRVGMFFSEEPTDARLGCSILNRFLEKNGQPLVE